MIASKLIKQIKAARTPIMVSVHNANDTMYVKVVKRDLIEALRVKSNGHDDYETGFVLDEDNYLVVG